MKIAGLHMSTRIQNKGKHKVPAQPSANTFKALHTHALSIFTAVMSMYTRKWLL